MTDQPEPTARQRLLDAMRNRTCFCGANSCHNADEYVDAYAHELAEQEASRVAALYEQWVKAGPPPLGAPLARWWDRRLVELNNAINRPAEHSENPPTSKETP